MSEHLEAPHSDNTVELPGPSKIMNPEILILEDGPEIVFCHLSDLLDQLCPSETENSDILVFEDQPETFIYHTEAPSHLQSQMHPSETVNPEILMFQNQPETFLFYVETLSDLQDQMHPPETVNSEILVFQNQPETFLCFVETLSDLQGQMHPSASQIQLNNLARSWENQEDPEVGFVYSQPAKRFHQMPQAFPPGEAFFQLLHLDNALPPTDHLRHFPARRRTAHVLMLQDSENKKLDSSQQVFQNAHRKFASLIQSRRRRFDKLPSTARRRLTYDL